MNLRKSLATIATVAISAAAIPTAFALTTSDYSTWQMPTASQTMFWSPDASMNTTTSSSGSWMDGSTNLMLTGCNNVTTNQMADCQTQLLWQWQMNYKAFQDWTANMNAQMKMQMEKAGISSVQIEALMNGTLNVQTNTNNGYSNSVTMQEAWKVCQEFTGRAQARCMRDALTNNSNFNSRFRAWTDLNESLNGDTNNN